MKLWQKIKTGNIPVFSFLWMNCTVLFIKNGQVEDKSVGAVPKAQLASKLDAIIWINL